MRSESAPQLLLRDSPHGWSCVEVSRTNELLTLLAEREIATLLVVDTRIRGGVGTLRRSDLEYLDAWSLGGRARLRSADIRMMVEHDAPTPAGDPWIDESLDAALVIAGSADDQAVRHAPSEGPSAFTHLRAS